MLSGITFALHVGPEDMEASIQTLISHFHIYLAYGSMLSVSSKDLHIQVLGIRCRAYSRNADS